MDLEDSPSMMACAVKPSLGVKLCTVSARDTHQRARDLLDLSVTWNRITANTDGFAEDICEAVRGEGHDSMHKTTPMDRCTAWVGHRELLIANTRVAVTLSGHHRLTACHELAQLL